MPQASSNRIAPFVAPKDGLFSRPFLVRLGYSFFRQDDGAVAVWRLRSGFVKLTRCEVGRALLVGWRSPDWLVGVSSAVLNRRYPVSAYALTECLVERADIAAFRCARAVDLELGAEIQEMLSDELHEMALLVDCLCSRDRRQRLKRLLVKWFKAGFRVSPLT